MHGPIDKRLVAGVSKTELKPLIVGAEKYGRIGNRLYLGAHLVAWAKKTGAELLNLGFMTVDLFEATYKDALCRFPESNQPILISKGFKDF